MGNDVKAVRGINDELWSYESKNQEQIKSISQWCWMEKIEKRMSTCWVSVACIFVCKKLE